MTHWGLKGNQTLDDWIMNTLTGSMKFRELKLQKYFKQIKFVLQKSLLRPQQPLQPT